MPEVKFEDWGLMDYQTALDKQLQRVEEVSQDETHPGFLVFCSHPHVVTTGRQTQPQDIFAWHGPVIEVSRGGRATYHGPSQLVAYPILNLRHPRHGRGPQEVRGYLRAMESAIVAALAEYGVHANGKTPQKLPGGNTESDETGVWVGPQKIASLGIAVKKWVTYHGAAINLEYDPEAFVGLNPCGFTAKTMVSLETLTGKKIDRTEFSEALKRHILHSV